jgi:phosphocarrier protein HPr
MLEVSYKIDSTDGVHARVATAMVNAAQRYSVDMKLIYKDKIIDVKSILGLMSLAIPRGEDIVLISSGERAEEAIRQVIYAIEKFK